MSGDRWEGALYGHWLALSVDKMRMGNLGRSRGRIALSRMECELELEDCVQGTVRLAAADRDPSRPIVAHGIEVVAPGWP